MYMLTKIIDRINFHKFLILIVLLGSLLRFCGVVNTPPSLNWDELSHGYNAYSLMRTGSDEWGETLPIIFRAYGDYKLPVYIYTTVISVAIFGLNSFAVRLPSVLAGIGSVITVYLLVRELGVLGRLGKKQIENIALLSALLVAVEPWSLFISRGAFEANFALFLFVFAIYLFLKSFRSQKYIFYSAVFFGLTLWTYNSYRVFTPLMVVSMVLIFRNDLVNLYNNSLRKVFIASAIFLIFFIPMLIQFGTGIGQARYDKVAIIDEGAINKINEQRNLSEHSPTISRLLYNRPVFFGKTFLNNWIQHYSVKYLFLEGGSQYQYSVPDHGLIYLINLPLLLFGFLYLLREAVINKEKYAIFLLTWIVLAPVPASITRDTTHVLRTVTMLPLPMIVTALGLFKIYEKYLSENKKTSRRRSSIYFGGYLIVIVILFANYWKVYTNEYRENYSWSWQYGYRETIEIVKDRYDNNEKIIFTKKYGEPHIFVLFYWPWDPDGFRSDPDLIRFEQSDWFWVDRFDKFYFVNDWEIPTRSDLDFVLESGEDFDCDFSRCLLVTSPGTVQQDWELLETVYFLDGEPAFEVYDNRK